MALGLALVSTAEAATAAKPRAVLTRVVQKLPAGKVWRTIQQGVLCVTRDKAEGDGVQKEIDATPYASVFANGLAQAGFGGSTDDRPNLFATPAAADETPAYEVAALVHDMDVKVCGVQMGATSLGMKGSASMQVQWQVYSPAKRQVVATIEAPGQWVSKERLPETVDGLTYLISVAFADSVIHLMQSPEFVTLMKAPPPKDELSADPAKQVRIAALGGRPGARAMSDASGSVVLVILPDGHGSGVLVSTDGYVLTNAHVVGQSKTVKIRWSDGFETTGEVLRVHQKRDVALIKTDPHGRDPLAIRTGSVQLGEGVMAIGTPLDLSLQNTLTRGVVSATNRIMDGYSFIQSDVSVNHGNSGGALLDEKGALVGLTDIGLAPDGQMIDLNFFIPIKDALDFLSLDLTPGQPVAEPVVQKAAAPVATPAVARKK